MGRKLIILIGAIAIIVSLMFPVTKEVPVSKENMSKSIFSTPQKVKKVVDYPAATTRTIAIGVGTMALIFILPKEKEKMKRRVSYPPLLLLLFY